MEPVRLELYPYHSFIESSEEKDAVLALVLSRNEMLLYVSPTSEVKGQRSPPTVQHDWRHFMKIGRCVTFHEDAYPLYQVASPYPPSLPSLPFLLLSPG